MSGPSYSPPAGGLTFARFQRRTDEFTGAEQLAAFCHDLGPEDQEACWAALSSELDDRDRYICECGHRWVDHLLPDLAIPREPCGIGGCRCYTYEREATRLRAPRPQPAPRQRWRVPTLGRGNVVPLRPDRRDDPLLEIPPAVYVERLTGIVVGHRRTIHCPLPDHRDASDPSFHVYPEPERGVWCFGCRRGGDIFNFASALATGDDHPRRADFADLRRALAQEFNV